MHMSMGIDTVRQSKVLYPGVAGCQFGKGRLSRLIAGESIAD